MTAPQSDADSPTAATPGAGGAEGSQEAQGAREPRPALNGRLLLAIRARTARARKGLHQSLRVTEADREALVLEVQRLREELELMRDTKKDTNA